MAKIALIEREKKRERLCAKYQAKREELRVVIANAALPMEERYLARLALQRLPRNANPTRHRNRCQITGRARGVFRKFGLCRLKVREMAFSGHIPGIVKASW